MSLLSFAKKISGRQEAVKPADKKSEAAAVATKSTVAQVPVAQGGWLGMQPLVTEESMMMQGNVQTVAFRVRPMASKNAIAAAVSEKYGVVPTSVRTVNVRGKIRRRGRSEGRSNTWKKAYVSLPAGKTIDLAA